MTDAQKYKFYFPAWNRCARNNFWTMTKGRLNAEPQENPLIPELAAVWTYALQIARDEHRGVVPDDLRHACHIVAIGRDKSSEKLTNREVNRVVELFDMLADPDDVTARMRWENPELAEKQGLIKSIKEKAPEDYIRKISEDKFGTMSWEDLDVHKLRQLVITVTNRRPTWSGPRPKTFTPRPAIQKLEYIKKNGGASVPASRPENLPSSQPDNENEPF